MNSSEFDTPFGEGCFVWEANTVYRIFIPSPSLSPEEQISKCFLHTERKNSAFSREITAELESLARGVEAVVFTGSLNFGEISLFKKAILNSLMDIPRGQTVSYGELAKNAGYPGAARAAGNVMSSNPFPLVIPCHRVVRADGSAGSYQGGTVMKDYLLEAESDR